MAADTTKKLASGLDAVQNRIDRIVGAPLTLRSWGAEGFPAQYQALEDPPVAEKARVYNAVRSLYDPHGEGGRNNGFPEHPTIAMTFGDSDVEAWKEKEKMKQQVDFDKWLTDHYDPFRNPAEAN